MLAIACPPVRAACCPVPDRIYIDKLEVVWIISQNIQRDNQENSVQSIRICYAHNMIDFKTRAKALFVTLLLYYK